MMKKITFLIVSVLCSLFAMAQVPVACNSTWLSTPSSNSDVNVGDLDISGNQLTVEALFNRTSLISTTPAWGKIVSKHTTGSDVNYALMTVAAEINTVDSGYVVASAPCAADTDRVYHVAMVYNGSTLKFYRNGFLMSSVPASGNLAQNNWNTMIANGSINQVSMQSLGFTNEVRIWNVARTQAQIQANMFTTLASPTTVTGLVGYYNFSTLTNQRGSGLYNGTLVGSAVINQANPNCTYVADSCCTPNTGSTVNKCSNESIVLSARPGTSYSWSPGTGLSSTTVQNPTCSVTSSITYYVTVANSVSGCSNVDTIHVNVNPAPVSNIADTTICIGDTIQLHASGGTTYSWTPNYHISSTTIASPYVWPAITTAYIVTITNAYGCSVKDTIIVTANQCACEDSCNWSLTGNSNVKSNYFLGSKNNAALKIRTNNTQRMIVTAAGDVGINTASPGKLLDVNGEARIASLPAASVNNSIVLANNSGDLKSLAATGDTQQYLAGNGTWQTLPSGGGTVSADQGCSLGNDNTVLLGVSCGNNTSAFQVSRQINMNDLNLYFNSLDEGKLFMGSTVKSGRECRTLTTRLEISAGGLTAANDYAATASTSGLRFTDLTALDVPVAPQYPGVLSLDTDGDVIWVDASALKSSGQAEISKILDRLDRLEKTNDSLKLVLNQMDVTLGNNAGFSLAQNVPNPFREKTSVAYYIPAFRTGAKMMITASNGVVVKEVDIKKSGKGMINFNTTNLIAGLYTYTLLVDGKVIETKKMIKE